MATPRVAAGALFVDQDGRVLLVQPTYKDFWDLPGGYVEPGESPLQACRRELQEELGITPHVGRLLVVDWAPLDDEGDKVLFVFDVAPIADTRQLHPAPEEIQGWEFVQPNQLADRVPDRLVKRIHLSLAARSERRTIYAEHGAEPHTGSTMT